MPDRFVSISDRVYRLLLVLYPPQFRRVYGPAMAQVFRDRCREERRHGQHARLLRLWLHTLADLAATAPGEHMQTLFQGFRNGLGAGFLTVALLALGVATAIHYLMWGVFGTLLLAPEAAFPQAPPDAMFWFIAATAVVTVIVVLVFATANLHRLRARQKQVWRPRRFQRHPAPAGAWRPTRPYRRSS